ncbi:MAG: 30S ribosomal protein S18 [Anaerolineae bacterium]|nr:30S ribosomal protein S18 [Anaerolineae bacterium]
MTEENNQEATAPEPQPARAPARSQRQRRRYSSRRKKCQFCVDKMDTIDYKDVNLLRQFLTEQGKIMARRKTGTCAKHQRRLATAIKRHLALLPFTAEHIRTTSWGER